MTPQGQVFIHEGPKVMVAPKALTEAEIAQTVTDFVVAARTRSSCTASITVRQVWTCSAESKSG